MIHEATQIAHLKVKLTRNFSLNTVSHVTFDLIREVDFN